MLYTLNDHQNWRLSQLYSRSSSRLICTVNYLPGSEALGEIKEEEVRFIRHIVVVVVVVVVVTILSVRLKSASIPLGVGRQKQQARITIFVR